MNGPLDITVDLDAADPPYEQVRRQIAGHIVAGNLSLGDRLPPIAALAADLGIAANTVGRAYKELEASGMVATRRRTGTVVTRAEAPGDRTLSRSAAAFVRDVVRSGASDTEAIDLVRAALREARA